jgi:ATP-dependent exoDNAse (exonuclease V) beta subunit
MSDVVADARARERALDPTRSCIVQAPAGSGKTGLLIQRYLRLLATVDRPEEVLAITFTRKAAAEMRRRVLHALEHAELGRTACDDNARLTRALATAVLERDRERNWSLRENASRLRIQTIDSLCASLARQMPVLSGLGAPPAIVDDARELYREAAERTLAGLEGDEARAAPMARLLRHLDGNWGTARTVLELMLARRDQWLRSIGALRQDADARASLEAALLAERGRLLARLDALIAPEDAEHLVRLARYAAARVGADGPLRHLLDLPGLPACDEGGADGWVALAGWLLKSETAEFRRHVSRNNGFPVGSGEAVQFKAQMMELLQRLTRVGGLCEALHALRGMPPARFTDAQWEVLGAIVSVLPLAAAQLQLVFAERGEIDFTGIAQAAVAALGDPEAPTDLLLALDVQLRHLLVDEFQDTSLGQWELLTRLTAGWNEGDGRTVFLVGDPMQSIYRFREADVAVYLRARREGLPQVALDAVRLTTNFRSHGALVAWFNETFARVMPPLEDAEAGAVPYSPATAHHAEAPGPSMEWHPFVSRDLGRAREREAERVAMLATAALAADATGTIAVLVRNRSHLDHIVPALKRARVPYRAVDIEPLADRPVIQDLLALSRALAHPADRIAWLSLLRAPWCALALADLHVLAGGGLSAEGARQTVWELIEDDERLARLPAAARDRCVRTREALRPFVEGRLRGGVRARVEGAWLALCGPAALDQASDLEDAETFFDQLDAIAEAGDLPEVTRLEDPLAKLYATPAAQAARVQLMTIHKAKGLEFDTVLVPGLDRCPRASDRPLFAWKARADGHLLMAPMRAVGEASEPAYDYLCALEAAANEHEVERLFYVAATRARASLHLLGCARATDSGLREPASRSLLGKAWPLAREAFERAVPLLEPEPLADASPARDELRRLEAPVFTVDIPLPAVRVPPAPAEEGARPEFSWAGETARHAGILVHRWLQRIGIEGVESWDAARIVALSPLVAEELKRRGVPPGERDEAARRVLEALQGALADPRGRWVLGRHPESRFEYRLRVASPDGVRLVVIDRVFTDAQGERWIVDYKTSFHEGADREGFLDREMERYRAQLTGYAAALGGAPARLGLYFPLMRAWRALEARELALE